MSPNSEAAPAKRPAKKEIIASFDPVAMRAPFFLRCGAVAFDYLLFIIWPVLGLVLGRSMGVDGTKLLSGDLNNIFWLIAILVGLSNCVLLPLITGQSLGKMLAGLRIVDSGGAHPSAAALMIRQTIGYAVTLLTLGLGFILSALNGKGRALHDYLTGSQVVYGVAKRRSQ